MKNLRNILTFASVIVFSLCALSQPGNYNVDAGAFYFSPATLTIEAGSTVTWTNVGGFHDVNFETNSITGADFNNPESFTIPAVYSAGPDSPTIIGSYTFEVEGTY